jgi:hypothetical protein
MYTVFLFYALLIIVNVLTSIPYVLGQTNETKQELLEFNKTQAEFNKTQAEIKLLESQTNPSTFFGTQILPILGAFAIAFVPAFIAWRHERNKIPTIEQEKIIHEIATNWYFHRHLTVYNKIWNKIETSQNQEKEVDCAWKYLCVKEFPETEYNGIEGFNAVRVKGDIGDYLAQRLNLSKKVRLSMAGIRMSELAYTRFMASYMLAAEEQLPENKDEIIAYTKDVLQAKGIECDKRISEMPEKQIKEILEQVRELRKNKKKSGNKKPEDKEVDSLRKRLDIIVDASSTTYYDQVRETLPRVAQKAVLATLGEKKYTTLGEKKYTTEEYKKVFEESLKKLKRMMIFYRLREDKKVAETILYAAVYDNLKDVSPPKQLENT